MKPREVKKYRREQGRRRGPAGTRSGDGMHSQQGVRQDHRHVVFMGKGIEKFVDLGGGVCYLCG